MLGLGLRLGLGLGIRLGLVLGFVCKVEGDGMSAKQAESPTGVSGAVCRLFHPISAAQGAMR